MIQQAHASCVGVGVVVEKAFQDGGAKLRSSGLRVEALARIASMADGEVHFVEDDHSI